LHTNTESHQQTKCVHLYCLYKTSYSIWKLWRWLNEAENGLLCLIFTALWTAEQYFGGTLHVVEKFLKYERTELERLLDAEVETHVQIYLRPCKFYLLNHNVFFLFVAKNKNKFKMDSWCL
jgi:hypothetical protein